jgi:endonuclease YncB( thermonuclease family)
MHSKTPARNRLAKVLPEEWRKLLVSLGVPKRKYTAVCRVTLTDGRVIEEMIVEEGWIIALDKAGLAGTFECRIDFDPRTITALEVLQSI